MLQLGDNNEQKIFFIFLKHFIAAFRTTSLILQKKYSAYRTSFLHYFSSLLIEQTNKRMHKFTTLFLLLSMEH